MKRHCWAMALVVTATLGVGPAQAQSATGVSRGCGTSAAAPLLTGTIRGMTRLPDKGSLALLGIGGAGALATHAADSRVSESLGGDRTLHRALTPGATIGGMPFETGAAAAIMGLGHALHRPCLGALGSELLQAQFVGAAWTIGLKQTIRRDRPEGTGFGFPSGHAATAFASATVLQRRFGWKAGIPAYAVASYVGVSRIQMQRHYLSDVAFGAALGIVAGRTVSVGHGHGLMITPLATPRGGGVGFSLVPSN